MALETPGDGEVNAWFAGCDWIPRQLATNQGGKARFEFADLWRLGSKSGD